MGKWDKAAMRYEEALRLDPHHEPALRGLAEIELHRGHQRAAVGLARILVDCDNRAATSQLLLARALLADNCPADALASAERARQLAPDVWECRLVEADALAALGRLGRAEERYLQTAADHPEALAAYLGVARCRERHQGARQALSYLQALPQAVQGRDQIAMAVARLHRDLGEESQAIARYREIVRRNPSLAEPRLSLARLLMKRGGLGDAQELLAGVLADEPGNVAALAGKHAGKALGDDEESNRSARLLFAEAEAACGRETQAIRLIRQNLAEQPKDLPSRRLLVGLLLRTGNADEALEEVKDIEELFPDRPDAASLRGDVYLAAANYEQAIASYRRALLQAPEDPVVMRQLAIVLCEQQGTLEEADSLSAKALQREPQDAETMDTRGWVLYRLGKADVAAAVLERATRLAPGDGTIHYHLGVVLADLGRKELAIQELRRALSSTTVSGARQDAQKRLASLLLAPDDE
jgi:tetratricopeptide (TPR) repeat protein